MCNNNIKISIIIPVYNVEKYIAECLDSCINQTLYEIEIICVDDCSPDNSILILEQMALKDSRIRIIRHNVNKGLGAARNTGIAAARGEYIWFVDSDDYIALEACQLLYETAQKHNIDVLCFNAIDVIVQENNSKKLVYDKYFSDWPKNVVLNPERDGTSMKGYFPVSACIYISKRTYISNFSFREGCYYEDTDFTPILFFCAPRLFCIVYTAYFRRITPGSITQTPLNPKKLNDNKSVVISLGNFIRERKVPDGHFLTDFFTGFSNYVFSLLSEKELLKTLNITPKDNVIIFGAGKRGKDIFRILTNNAINISFFVDSDNGKQGSLLFNTLIKSPEVLKHCKGIVIIAIEKADKEIKNQIEKMQNDDLKIIEFDFYIKAFEKAKAKTGRDIMRAS